MGATITRKIFSEMARAFQICSHFILVWKCHFFSALKFDEKESTNLANFFNAIQSRCATESSS